MSLPLSVLSQSGPPKSVGGRGGGSGRVPHFNWSIYRSEPGLKLDEKKWTKNRLRIVSEARRSERFSWVYFLGVVATILIQLPSSRLLEPHASRRPIVLKLHRVTSDISAEQM